MVTQYGMDDSLGLATWSEQPSRYLGELGVQQPQRHFYSERVADEIDAAVQTLVSEAFDRATEILSCNREMLTQTAEKLLQQETLSRDELPTPIWNPPQESRHSRNLQNIDN